MKKFESLCIGKHNYITSVSYKYFNSFFLNGTLCICLFHCDLKTPKYLSNKRIYQNSSEFFNKVGNISTQKVILVMWVIF